MARFLKTKILEQTYRSVCPERDFDILNFCSAMMILLFVYVFSGVILMTIHILFRMNILLFIFYMILRSYAFGVCFLHSTSRGFRLQICNLWNNSEYRCTHPCTVRLALGTASIPRSISFSIESTISIALIGMISPIVFNKYSRDSKLRFCIAS